MPRVVFEPTIPFFERVKTVHASDREATVTVLNSLKFFIIYVPSQLLHSSCRNSTV
jgi:hypothetical protein